MLFISETFDLKLDQIAQFADLFHETWQPKMEELGARLVGLWESVCVSRPFPTAVALWETDGAITYQDLVFQLYQGDRGWLREWQRQLAGCATGGEGRLLNPTEKTPTFARLKEAKVDMSTIVHERITAQPDQQRAYVEGIEDLWLPTARVMGRVWIGTYYTAWRNFEAFSFWALDNPGRPLPSGQEEHLALESEGTRRWMEVALSLRENYDDGIYVAL